MNMEEYCRQIAEALTNNIIPIWTLILTVVSTILWGVYVIFTTKTFVEIKKQTNFLSRSFLVVKPVYEENTIEKGFDSKAIKIHNQWKQILNNNIPTAIKQESCFSFNLTNRGRSDIVQWEIEINFEVEVGEYLKSLNVTGDSYNFVIKSKSIEQIAPEQEIQVNIIPFGFYPSAKISWKIKYTDIRRNIDYVIGNDSNIMNNVIAYEFIKKDET